jgi:hypothetical protein
MHLIAMYAGYTGAGVIYDHKSGRPHTVAAPLA